MEGMRGMDLGMRMDAGPARQLMLEYERVYRGSGLFLHSPDGLVGLSLAAVNRSEVELCGIESYGRGKGHASAALRWLTQKADEYRVTLSLLVDAEDPTGLAVDDLVAWYARHGFTSEAGGSRAMRRLPR